MPRARIRAEEGQVLIVTALALVVLLGFAGIVVDVGRGYLAQRQLQQAVDAAALAAGQSMPDSTLAEAKAEEYSATGVNAHNVSMSAAPAGVRFRCVAFNSAAVPCVKDPADATNPVNVNSPCKRDILASGVTAANYAGCNAVVVSQQSTVKTIFARLFKKPTFTISAKATASMRGGVRQPLDIMFVLDSTGSMDSNCNQTVADVNGTVAITAANSKKIDCAKDGVRQFLKSLQPCKLSVNGNCPNSGTDVVDKVGLMTFPGLANGNATNHDSTGARTNFMLETTASCSARLTSTPAWYVGGGGFPQWFLKTSDLSYGSAASPARATVTITQTAGTFTLTFGGQTTAPLAWNVNSNVAVQNALTALGSIGPGNVGVTRNNNVYTITFQGALGNQAVGPVTAAASGSAVVPPAPTIATLTAGGPGTNETQIITVPQVSGSFTLTYAGQTTANINWNAPATGAGSVQTALTNLNNIGNTDVAVTRSGAAPYVYTVTFQGALAGQNVAQITTATANVATATTRAGVPAVNEVQTVTLAQTNGTFALTYAGQTTAAINWNAPATGGGSVQTALVNLNNIGNGDVAVTRSGAGTLASPYVYTVTFQGALGGTNVAQMTATGTGNVPAPGPSVVSTNGSTGVNEVQAVTVTQSTGTFTLTYSGQTTAPVAWNASSATVQTALTNLSNIGNTDVTVTRSGAGPYVFTVTFQGALGAQDVPQLTAAAQATPITDPSVINTPYTPATSAGYMITGLANDYRLSNAATTLNPASPIVNGVYWSSCTPATWPSRQYYGLNAVGGVNTYYAGALQEAQFALEADAARNAQPVIILLSDGDANATASNVPNGRQFNQCHQAIDAATVAASSAIHTLVYSIAYLAPTSATGSCSSDSPRISAWETMRQIARNSTTPGTPDPEHFYCFPAATGCTSGTSLADIFKQIAADLTSSRLIPDDVS